MTVHSAIGHGINRTMRVLGRIRLSRYTEESTSVERQRELIQHWADKHDHTIVGWAEDVDVSGSLSPFDAPQLAPWFKPPKSNEWDILCAWKLDRIARNSIGLHAVFAWLQENNKTLVCIEDSIDLSNWVGRLVASVIAGVAEGELAAMTERNTAARKTLRQEGRWAGGRPGYGYRPVKTNQGWRLEHDPEEQPILREMIDRILAGESAGSIADSLNERGIPTARERRYGVKTQGWTGDGIRQTLRSKHTLGWITHEAKPVLDAAGKPVPAGPPTITLDTWKRLQEALSSRSFKKQSKDRTSPLLGILECWQCGGPMYIRRTRTAAGTIHEGYHCKRGCKQKTVNGRQARELVYSSFRDELGDSMVMEKKVTHAEDTTAELEEAKQAYSDIADFVGTAPTAEARKQLLEQLTLVGERIKTLEQAPNTDTVEWEQTGQTYQDLWDNLDEEGKRQLMLKTGIRACINPITGGTRHGYGTVEYEFIVPDDLKQRLS